VAAQPLQPTDGVADTSPKADLRRDMMALRRNIRAKNEAASRVAGLMQGVLARLARPQIIAGYFPIGDELDCRPTLERFRAAGMRLCLPVVVRFRERLAFRRWAPGDALAQGPFGTSHPLPAAPAVTPDVVLVPLLAFDRTGHRLGYGAGYYDRTLAALRREGAVLAIGLAFDGQEVASLPTDPNDQPLDMVVTDRRVLTMNRSPLLLS
jgi:5-formyltetrahydrofolate cyclo-ligase